MASSTDVPGRRGRAVVIGASIAGLLAARALSETYARVTVIDRDTLPDHPAARKGMPQGRFAHALLAAGADVLEELFPGLRAEMIASGAFTCDIQGDYRWYLDGYPLRQAHAGLAVIGLTRPLLEHLIRARVAGLPDVTIVSPAEVTGLETAAGTSSTARRAPPSSPSRPSRAARWSSRRKMTASRSCWQASSARNRLATRRACWPLPRASRPRRPSGCSAWPRRWTSRP